MRVAKRPSLWKRLRCRRQGHPPQQKITEQIWSCSCAEVDWLMGEHPRRLDQEGSEVGERVTVWFCSADAHWAMYVSAASDEEYDYKGKCACGAPLVKRDFYAP
jgi:hypothetical protein